MADADYPGNAIIIGNGSVLTLTDGVFNSQTVPKSKVLCIRHNDDGSMELWLDDAKVLGEPTVEKKRAALKAFAGLEERKF